MNSKATQKVLYAKRVLMSQAGQFEMTKGFQRESPSGETPSVSTFQEGGCEIGEPNGVPGVPVFESEEFFEFGGPSAKFALITLKGTTKFVLARLWYKNVIPILTLDRSRFDYEYLKELLSSSEWQ